MHEQLEILTDKICDEVEDSKKYMFVYIATGEQTYLDMARQELMHAEQFEKEARAVTAEAGRQSPFLFWQQTRCAEKAYHKLTEQKKLLNDYL